MLKTLPFHMTQQIIPFDTIAKKNELIFSVLENHLYEMSQNYIQEAINALFTPKNSNQSIGEYILKWDILFRLTVIIHRNIKRAKKIKQDAVFILFYEIVKYINSFPKEAEYMKDIMINIWNILDFIIEQNLLDNIDVLIIADLMFIHFTQFKTSLISSMRKLILKKENELTDELDSWRNERRATFGAIEMAQLFIKKIFLKYDRPICHINRDMYIFISNFSLEETEIIMRKVSVNAIISLISSLIKYSYQTFDIHVDPLNMVNTAIVKGANLASTIFDFVSLKKKPYIIYENANGQLGIDAGGLTRDFYTQYLLQLQCEMDKKDNYMTFGELKVANSLQRMRFAGVVTAYAIFIENISPNIRFHPILSYFIIHGSLLQNCNDILDFLEKYDIEYVKNMKKIQILTKEEYIAYLDMQGEEEFIPKKKYLQKLLQDRYICPSFIAFIRGFRDIYTQVDKNSFITSNMLYDYMIGIESYKIIGEKNTLESILKIDCGDNTSMSKKDKTNIKQWFLEVLEDMNQNNISMLKDLLRFWHGTHGIQEFEHLDLTLRILYGKDDLYGCFSSSTCFGKLYIHNSHLISSSKEAIKDCFIRHIKKTLENQKIVESAGMHMQMD
jgi:hypothetical protein